MMRIYLLLSVCLAGFHGFAQVTVKPTYRSYAISGDSIRDEGIDNLLERFSNDDEVKWTAAAEYGSSWMFKAGDPAEGLFTRVNKFTSVNKSEWTTVELPHRVDKPDHPLWYSQSIKFRSKGFLRIDADDGAQLFLNDRQVLRKEGNCFPIDAAGTFVVTIRVLNNAMSGGLRRVRFIRADDLALLTRRRITNESQTETVHKLLLLTTPNEQVMYPGAVPATPPEVGVISEVGKSMEDIPFLFPCLLPVSDSEMIVTVHSGNIPVTLKWGETKENLQHEITLQKSPAFFPLRGLEPDKTYYYQLRAAKTITEVYSFRNAPASPAFSFNVWADSQSGLKGFRHNVSNIAKANDAFGIGVGDLVSDGDKPRHWQKFFDILSISGSHVPYYLIAGNHDYDGFYDSLQAKYYGQYTNRTTTYFSWTHQNAAFIALDPNENFPIGIPEGSAQHRWLVEQLHSDAWRKATWRFVLLHQTLYSQGWSGYGGDDVLRKTLEPLIESSGIDFIISGHTHDYERLIQMYGRQKVMFLVVGGAGGSLEPPESSPSPVMDKLIKKHHVGRFYIDGKKLRFECIGLDNAVLDSFQMEKQ